MGAWKLALAGAVVAVVAFAVKAVVIGSAGLGESSAEDVFFFVGQLALIVGAASLGVHLTAGRPTGARVLGAVVIVVVIAAISGVVALLMSAAAPDDAGWVWGEVNLWVGALVLLAAVLAVRRRAALLPEPG